MLFFFDESLSADKRIDNRCYIEHYPGNTASDEDSSYNLNEGVSESFLEVVKLVVDE